MKGRLGSHQQRAKVLGEEVVTVQFASAAASAALSTGYDMTERSAEVDAMRRKMERVEFNLLKLSQSVAAQIRLGSETRGCDFADLLGKLRNAAAYASEQDPDAIDQISPGDSEAILAVIERAFRAYGIEPHPTGTH